MQKTKQLLYYITAKHPKASITVLMKLCYLIDLIAVKELGNKISEFDYRRYFYGPFDAHIYQLLENMQAEGLIEAEMYFTPDTDYAVYSVGKELEIDNFSDDEIKLIDESLKDFVGYGAKALTEIAYRTKPMTSIGATLGGDEQLNKQLDLASNGSSH